MSQYKAMLVLTDAFGEQQIAGADTVWEPDETPVYTGIVSAHGVPVYRIPERRIIGYRLGKVRS